MCCIACGTGASKECIGNGCPGQTTPWNSCNHKWQLVSARIKWPLVSHCETHPRIDFHIFPYLLWICAREDEARWEAPNDLRDQIIFGAASPLSESGEAWERIAKRPWTCLNWMSCANLRQPSRWGIWQSVNCMASTSRSLLYCTWVGKYRSPSQKCSNFQFLVSSGVPRTPVTSCDEQDMWTHSSEGWSIKSRALSDKHEIGFKAG